MKKIFKLFILTAIAVCCVCGCTRISRTDSEEAQKVQIVTIEPTELISLDTVKELTGYDMTDDGTKESDGVKSVLYRTEPIGEADTVKVEVRQYSETVAKEEIQAKFDEMRSKRSSAETIDTLGCDAYVAYPSLHFYCDGYLVTITAGSGSDDGQKELLVRFAEIAVENLRSMISVS